MENRTGFGPRLGAYLLDLVLIIVISVILIFGLGLKGMATGAMAAGTDDAAAMVAGAATGFLGSLMASMIIIYIIAAAWYLLEGLTGFTIGKLIVGIQIGNSDGTKAGIGKLLLRYIIKNIYYLLSFLALLAGISFLRTLGGILALVILIGCFFVLGAKKQAFHDMIAKTAVYKRSELK